MTYTDEAGEAIESMNTREIENAVLLSELRTACANGRARQIRTEASLSTSDVARVAGVLPSVITRWELGERRPRAGAPAVAYARLLARLNGGAL